MKSMNRFVVTGPLPTEAMEVLPAGPSWIEQGPEPMRRERLLEEAAHAEGLLCFLSDRIDTELLAASQSLRVVSQVAVGVDNIDLGACTAAGIAVGHTPDVLTDTTADTAVALLLAAVRRLPEGERLVRAGKWEKWSLDLLVGGDVHHSTIGIVGLGRIGTAIARRLRAFGCSILYTGPTRKPELEVELSAEHVDLDTLLARSDHVILAAPLRATTRHLIGAAQLRQMKPEATLVNIARGGLVDHEALAQALALGLIGRAALDVTDPEPIPADHPLVGMDNCLIIPHLGSASERTRTAMAVLAVENLRLGLEGARLKACANPEVYS